MAVVNMHLKKREEHRMTYKSEGSCTHVDYSLCKSCILRGRGDCTAAADSRLQDDFRHQGEEASEG